MAFYKSRCFLNKYQTSYFLNIIRNENTKTTSKLKYEDIIEDEFRKLQILPDRKEREAAKELRKHDIVGPRYKRMAVNQDWPTVWPATRIFHPATVPLPLHQGLVKDDKVIPGKFDNLELMKIPNFLHLSPPAIKKHCAVLRKFCTPWPKGLESDSLCEKYFPIQITTSDYVWSAVSIREPRARIVNLRIKMSRLPLDYHAKDKMKRLLGKEKYNSKTDVITITADRCPLKKQNYDYAHYLLTALFYESWKTEKWEEEITEDDWERFYWEKSQSRKTIVNYMKQVNPNLTEEQILENEKIKNYAKAVSEYQDQEENETTLENYKQSVVNLMFN